MPRGGLGSLAAWAEADGQDVGKALHPGTGARLERLD